MNRADALKYKALQKALEDGQARIFIDYNKLGKPSSPIYNPWEALLPVLVPILIGLILILSVGILFGLIFICLMIFLFNTFVKKFFYVHLIKRTKKYMVENYENCQKIWEHGGIILINMNDQKSGCVAPDGDWKDFVALNFSDLMSDKK